MRVVPWLVGLVGCGVHDEASFVSEFAQRWCARQEECALGEFERAYDSQSDCWTDKEEHPGIKDADKGCDLDPDGANDCLDYLSTTDCGGWEHKEIDHACDHAFLCP